jgi:hypothetical protein
VVYPASTQWQPPGANTSSTLYLKTSSSFYLSATIPVTLPNAYYALKAPQLSGVVMQQTGNNQVQTPISGLPVTLTDCSDPANVYQSVTDGQGNFYFSPPIPSASAAFFNLQLPPTFKVGPDTLALSANSVNPQGVGLQPDVVPPPLSFLYTSQLSIVSGQVMSTEGGLQGVPVELVVEGQKPQWQSTDQNGAYQFPNVPPGSATLRFGSAVQPANQSGDWELKPGQQGAHSFTIRSGQIINAPPVEYQPEEHSLEQEVRIAGLPAEYVLVDVRYKGALYALQSQRTGKDGKCLFILPKRGEYEVRVYPDPAASAGPHVTYCEVNSRRKSLMELPAPVGSSGSGAPQQGGGGSREPVSDLQSFPVLTQDFSPGALPSGTTPPIGGSSSLGLIADKAIREVLSWRAKGDDPKGFLGALNQAFDLKQVEGHTEWTWTPRSYTVQTDMGAVTGAQASIYTRAKVALDQSMPLLDGLYPLTPNVEAEDLATVQSVVRSQFTALVNEFGVVGGPRVPRVDELFDLLLSRKVTEQRNQRPDPETIPRAGSLGLVRERFGMQRRDVVSIEDEQNLTNYLILVDYVIGLWESWNYYRDFFVRTRLGESKDPFFGTQLVLISRALEVVAQGVQDAYYTMDSVFIGDAERQTTQLDFAHLNLNGIFIPDAQGGREQLVLIDSRSGLFIAELLDWVYRSASEELPALLQDAGKDGIESFKASTDRLRRFVHASRVPPQHAPALPPGYYTPRVQRSLQLLADGLDEAYGLAHQIRLPDLPVPFTDKEMKDLRKLLLNPQIRG